MKKFRWLIAVMFGAMSAFFKPIKNLFIKVKAMINVVYKPIDKALETSFDWFMRFFHKYQIAIVVTFLTLTSIAIRLCFFEYASGDFFAFLKPWLEHIDEVGAIGALKTNPPSFNYPVSYLNLLIVFNMLPVRNLFVIKILSCLFDYALAIGCFLVVSHFTKDKFIRTITYVVFIFMPTGILNSALWGQSDQTYVCLVVFGLYFLLKKHNRTAMLFVGLAFSIKLQTLFFFPVLAFMWLNKRLTIRQMLYMPLAVFITFIPSLWVGVSLSNLVQRYFDLANYYQNLNMGSGSFYAFFENGYVQRHFNMGASIWIALSLILVAIYTLYHKKIKCTDKNLMYVATFFAIFTPFVMPHMHERYFFMADVFLILYVLVTKRRYFLGVLMNFSSFLSYTHFLMGLYVFAFLGQSTVQIIAVMNAVIIGFLISDLKNLERIDDETDHIKTAETAELAI